MARLAQLASEKPPLQISRTLVLGADVRSIFDMQRTESLMPDDVLFWEADPAEDIFQLVEGAVRLYCMMPDGRRAISGFAFAGDLLGLFFSDQYLYTAEAITSVKLRRLQRSDFQAVSDGASDFSRQLSMMISATLSDVQDHILLLARKTARERVASFLLSIAPRLHKGQSRLKDVLLPMSRQDMADHLGLTAETISREMSLLRRKGLICLHNPHHVVIRDAAALAALAGKGL